jgi:4-hydroxy-tetrahydrodipicolinate synthase
VASAAGLPVMLYDIPGRTGVTIAEDTYRRVAQHERVVAVKDAVGDLARGVRIMSETGLAFYSGDDVLNLGWLTHGACGVVSVVGHVAGDAYRRMVDAVDGGDLTTALATYRELEPLVRAVMTTAQGAMTAKAALQLLGVLPNRHVRLPLVPADDALVDHLREALARAHLLNG